MNLDHSTIPAGRKTARVRGWRVRLLRMLAAGSPTFTARQLADLAGDGMTLVQAQALCASYIRKGELRVVRKGIGGSDPVEALYARKA